MKNGTTWQFQPHVKSHVSRDLYKLQENQFIVGLFGLAVLRAFVRFPRLRVGFLLLHFFFKMII